MRRSALDHPSRTKWVSRLDGVSKHPLILVILSVALGSWLVPKLLEDATTARARADARLALLAKQVAPIRAVDKGLLDAQQRVVVFNFRLDARPGSIGPAAELLDRHREVCKQTKTIYDEATKQAEQWPGDLSVELEIMQLIATELENDYRDAIDNYTTSVRLLRDDEKERCMVVEAAIRNAIDTPSADATLNTVIEADRQKRRTTVENLLGQRRRAIRNLVDTLSRGQ
jgi:hypothetical protein